MAVEVVWMEVSEPLVVDTCNNAHEVPFFKKTDVIMGVSTQSPDKTTDCTHYAFYNIHSKT